jgi:hypothetical protein
MLTKNAKAGAGENKNGEAAIPLIRSALVIAGK